MGENKRSLTDLYQMQSLPLSAKIQMTRQRIKGWVEEYGEDGVYVSFSGGKDSTVLLDIVRKDYPGIPAVFVDTGLEYPEIREFVKGFDNVVWLKPEKNFRKVIEQYGYPWISKRISDTVEFATKNVKNNGWNQDNIGSVALDEMSERLSQMLGKYNAWYENRNGTPPSKKGIDMRNYSKWQFLLWSPFRISGKCCEIMKKHPAKKYASETGRNPITGETASESELRTTHWLKNGCNGFDMKNPKSMPMAFWTEQDVLLYIKQNNLKLASVYGDVVYDNSDNENFDTQLTFSDVAEWKELGIEESSATLKTTGCQRTGCMFCGFGCHLNNDQRFVDMKQTHPKTYEWIMKPWDEGGLGYKEVIDWINEHGNLNIKY